MSQSKPSRWAGTLSESCIRPPSGARIFSRILIHCLIVPSTTLSTSAIHHRRFTSRAWDMKLITQVESFRSSGPHAAPNEEMKGLVNH